jgi:hypothetical protein
VYVDGIELVHFKDGKCHSCRCPVQFLDMGSTDQRVYCQACTEMVSAILYSEYWKKHHLDWVQQEKNKRRLKSGEDYFPG